LFVATLENTMPSIARFTLVAALLTLNQPLLASPAPALTFGHAAPAAQASRTIELVLGDMYFDPKAVQVKAGETVRFVLINKGQLLHEFNLGDAAMHASHQQEMIKMQQSGMLTPTGMAHHDMGHGALIRCRVCVWLSRICTRRLKSRKQLPEAWAQIIAPMTGPTHRVACSAR